MIIIHNFHPPLPLRYNDVKFIRGGNMRACSLVCIVGIVFLLINQFYRGLNLEQLFIGGFVLVAIWTDCECWVRYKLRRRKHG